MTKVKWHEFERASELDGMLAQKVASLLQEGIDKRNQATLVVSGGKTPVGLYRQLAQQPLHWQQITIVQADERCLPMTHADSNARMVSEHLLQHYAQNARFIMLYDSQKDNKVLASLPEDILDFDVVLLGMGKDGHTASLFPCAQNLTEAMADNGPDIVHIMPNTAPYDRVTLSRARLQRGRKHFLHLVGEEKKSTCLQAIKENDPYSMPVCAFFGGLADDLQIFYAAQE